MKAILQRVLSASVSVNGQTVSSIGKGVLVLAAVGPDDGQKDVDAMASKVLKLKMWPDESDEEQWKRSVQEIEGEVLCISQFTLFASTRKGNKPDFHGAAKPEVARELYQSFVSRVKAQYDASKVQDGVFQAMMQVSLVNDGPVTLEVDTSLPRSSRSANSTNVSGTSTPAVSNEDGPATRTTGQKT